MAQLPKFCPLFSVAEKSNFSSTDYLELEGLVSVVRGSRKTHFNPRRFAQPLSPIPRAVSRDFG